MSSLLFGQSRFAYLSPGVQVGFTSSKTLFISTQISFGLGTFLEGMWDALPVGMGITLGTRWYRSDIWERYRYMDAQLVSGLAGIGIGRISNDSGFSSRRYKGYLGVFANLTYDMTFKDKDHRNNFGAILAAPLIPDPWCQRCN